MAGMDDETKRIAGILRQAAKLVEDLSEGTATDDGGWIEPVSSDLRPAAFAAAVDMLARPQIIMREGVVVTTGPPTVDLLDDLIRYAT